jgi:hypothetical protein
VIGDLPPEGAHRTEAQDLARLLPPPPAPDLSDDRLRQLRRQVMGEIRVRRPRRRRRVLVTAIAAGALAAALFAGVSLSTESGSHRPGPGKTIYPSPAQSPTPYPTNAAGQTYGGAQEGVRADLWGVVATRGANGYVWPADLEGPRPLNAEEAEWMQAFQKRREVAVYESDGVTQVGVFIAGGGGPLRVQNADGTVTESETSNELAKQPPVWLFDSMKEMASQAGDANAWGWWTLTTAERAATATGDAAGSDPEKPVFVTFLLGDFTKWLWSLPEGTSTPEYSWICQIIDADTHEVLSTGASPKPFEGAKGLDLNIVGLRDRLRQ